MPNPFVILQDGKPVFIGKEDPANPPVQPPDEKAFVECPICGTWVPYLVGEDTQDGGKKGCEADWVPRPKKENEETPTNETYETEKEIE
jgi:hypothetical protein